MAMLDLTRAFKSERSIKALTGVTFKEFEGLLANFGECFKNFRKSRDIRLDFGRRHTLRTNREKLFFALFYLKCYPTFDLAGFFFSADRSRAYAWQKEFLQVLQRILRKEIVLPKRKIRSVEEFFQIFPEAKEIWIDGTERPIRRPKDKKRRKSDYSGKKKRHTKKNLIISNKKKEVKILTRTTSGRKHDYALFKQQKLYQVIPPKIRNWLDRAFQGIQKDFPNLDIYMPCKAGRGHPLTEKQKARNQKISSKRVKIEHAIGGMKRLRILTDVLRSVNQKAADQFVLLGAGLWNYHLKMG
jgi:hypothetical protein